MITKKSFWSVTTLMLLLFLAFQFTGAAKQYLSNYGANEYADAAQNTAAAYQKKDAYVAAQDNNATEILYIGKTDDTQKNVVQQWCEYSKKRLLCVSSCQEAEAYTEAVKEILVQGSALQEEDIARLISWNEAGHTIIFCDLPSDAMIQNSPALMQLLGINYIPEHSIHLVGVHLFGGFLLGGEEYYQATTEKEKVQQDMQLTIPWYVLSEGTETYMAGMVKKADYKNLKNEYLPAIIWRASNGNANVFAVNGDYMEDMGGIGILSAMEYENQSYLLYPVVNSQNIVVANYPSFAEENKGQMMKIYSKDATSVLRDIVWSGIASVSESRNAKITCMLSPQLDYSKKYTYSKKTVSYFMEQIKEENGEAGISLKQYSNIAINKKLNRDLAFFKTNLPQYVLQTAYVPAKEESEAQTDLSTAGFTDIKSMVTDYSITKPLLSYASNDITNLRTTNEGLSHTYREDLREKGIQTALAYSTVTTDFGKILYPKSKKDEWQKLYEKFSSYINTYWKPFDCFRETSVSEGNTAVRNFLTENSENSRKNNTVTLRLKNGQKTGGYYILRTHNQTIKKIQGATYTMIETDAYLLELKSSRAKITLQDISRLKYKK